MRKCLQVRDRKAGRRLRSIAIARAKERRAAGKRTPSGVLRHVDLRWSLNARMIAAAGAMAETPSDMRGITALGAIPPEFLSRR